MKLYKMVELGKIIQQAKVVKCGSGEYPVLSMTMHNGLIFQDEKFKKAIASGDKSEYKVVYRNQLVVSFPIDEGVIAAQRITDAGIVSPAYAIWDIDQRKVLPEYLEKALRCERALQYYKAKLRGSTARRRSLPVPVLLAFRVPMPTIEEQKSILDIIHLVESVIAGYRNKLEQLDLLIKARFVEMFGAYKWNSIIGDYIDELRGGKSLAGTEPCKNKVLKTGAATFGWFDPEQYKYLPQDYEPIPEHRVETGDVIISRMNTPELVGACSYVFQAPENMYYPDRLWKVIPRKGTNPIFLWQLLWDPAIRRQIKEKSGGTSGTMHNISKQKLMEIKCISVPVDVQDQYADFVAQVVKSKLVVQKALDEAQLLFDSLMQEYFG